MKRTIILTILGVLTLINSTFSQSGTLLQLNNNPEIFYKFDLFRLMYQVPSINISIEKPLTEHFNVEGGLNYYLKYEEKKPKNEYIGYMNSKLTGFKNFNLYGIFKYFPINMKFSYIGIRSSIGKIKTNHERWVCQEVNLNDFGFCECTQKEYVDIDINTIQLSYGIRVGRSIIAPNNKLLVDIFMDFMFLKNLQTNKGEVDKLYDVSCGEDYDIQDPFKKYYNPDRFHFINKLTDGIFYPQSHTPLFLFQASIKIGYAF